MGHTDLGPAPDPIPCPQVYEYGPLPPVAVAVRSTQLPAQIVPLAALMPALMRGDAVTGASEPEPASAPASTLTSGPPASTLRPRSMSSPWRHAGSGDHGRGRRDV